MLNERWVRGAIAWAAGCGLAWWMAGCAGGGDPVSPTDFCTQLAQALCANDQACCSATYASLDAGTPSLDAGMGPDAGGSSCQTTQLAACQHSLGAMIQDPRLGYVPANGGTFLTAVRAGSMQCGTTPGWNDVAAMFAGTGVEHASCTPPTLSGLATSEASCGNGTTCRLYLNTDGSLNGVCEHRADGDDACSHPYDCPTGHFCNLSRTWQPGEWGHCQPLELNGSVCNTDLACSSHFCTASGTCAARARDGVCFAQNYPDVVASSLPTIYWRLGDVVRTSAADSSGFGNDGAYTGTTSRAPTGALRLADDGALHLDGTNGAVSVATPAALAPGSTLTLEAWIRAGNTMAARPIVGFFDPSAGAGFNLATTGDGTVVTADFVDTTGVSHPVSSAVGVVVAQRWMHIVGTFDGSVGTLYIDGEPVAHAAASTLRVSGQVQVGFRPAQGTGAMSAAWVGDLDEVAAYAQSLSPTDVLKHRTTGVVGEATTTYPLFGIAP